MGDPKKIRKKYSTPVHPWQKERIDEERILSREYGLRNKKELWKVSSTLKNFKDQVKSLATKTSAQAEKEKEQLRARLQSYGLMDASTTMESVLELEVKDLMERRLQTVLVRKGLAKTMNQSRQFIVHRHIMVGGKKVTVPSYLVKASEEGQLAFVQSSKLSDLNHPERFEEVVPKEVKKKEKKKEVEEVAAFEEVLVDEEAILKEMDKKPAKEEEKEAVEVVSETKVSNALSSESTGVTESKDSGTQKPKVSVVTKTKSFRNTEQSSVMPKDKLLSDAQKSEKQSFSGAQKTQDSEQPEDVSDTPKVESSETEPAEEKKSEEVEKK